MCKAKTPPATRAEVDAWRALREAGLSFRTIGRQVGRSHESVRVRLDPVRFWRRVEARERQAARKAPPDA